MKAIIPLLLILLVGCSSPVSRTFTPSDPAAIEGAVKATHEKIKKAEVAAANIQRAGAAAGSPEATTLLLTLRAAEADARSAEKALEDFKLTDSRKFDEINLEVKNQTSRADSAESRLSRVMPQFWRLRIAVVAGIVIGALSYFAGPSIRAAAGVYGDMIPPGLAGAALVIVVLAIASIIILVGAIFGFL